MILKRRRKMADIGPRNWREGREEWERDRGLYELELRQAYAEASSRRARWLTAAIACHVVTSALVPGGLALWGFALAAASALILMQMHRMENEVAWQEISQKLELKFPEKLTPRPPDEEPV
jgi:hypothetical protein